MEMRNAKFREAQTILAGTRCRRTFVAVLFYRQFNSFRGSGHHREVDSAFLTFDEIKVSGS